MVDVVKVKRKVIIDDDGPVPFTPDVPGNTLGAKRVPVETVIVRRLHPNRFRHAEQERSIWLIYPDATTKFETLLEPSFWSHVAKQLRPGAHIEVFAENGSYWAELLVRSASQLSAQVAVLRKIDLGPAVKENTSAFTVEYSGPINKHAVIRKRDNMVVQGGFDTAEGAMGWLAANTKTLAGQIMPLAKGSSPTIVGGNIREFHTGQTYQATKKKFGKKKADAQAIAVAMQMAHKTIMRPPK